MLGMDDFPQPSPYNEDRPDDLLQQSSNCKGSSSCRYLKQQTCIDAVAQYDDNTMYTGYTSLFKYVDWKAKNSGSLGGCTAMFSCKENLCPSGGVSGAVIKEKFLQLYNTTCEICGTVEWLDYTVTTFNECARPCKTYINGVRQ